MSLIHHETPKARKAHRCCECGHKIAPGTVYVRQRSHDCGDIWTYKAHTECYEFAREMDTDEGVLLDDPAHWLDYDPPPVVRARLEKRI
jgi:hypothetical protein